MDRKMGWLCDHAVIVARRRRAANEPTTVTSRIAGLENPTFENIAVWLWDQAEAATPRALRKCRAGDRHRALLYRGE